MSPLGNTWHNATRFKLSHNKFFFVFFYLTLNSGAVLPEPFKQWLCSPASILFTKPQLALAPTVVGCAAAWAASPSSERSGRRIMAAGGGGGRPRWCSAGSTRREGSHTERLLRSDWGLGGDASLTYTASCHSKVTGNDPVPNLIRPETEELDNCSGSSFYNIFHYAIFVM